MIVCREAVLDEAMRSPIGRGRLTERCVLRKECVGGVVDA